MIRLHLAAVLTGCFLDLCFGDPHWLWHPVCGIGSLISWLEKKLRERFPKGDAGERRAGLWLVILVLLITGTVSGAILWTSYFFSPYVGFLIESIMCGQMMAWRSLREESMKVYKAFSNGDVEGARQAVSMIVGRDTKELPEEGITKAAVETVAENTSDGIIAPLLFMALFGGLGVFLYKAVNTMDSMVGYKNDKYIHFGRTAAKLDDVLNFIPARLAAELMIFACRFTGFNRKNARRIYLRDRFNHPSPNSAHTEAVCAGALGIRLAGDAWYFGILHKKPFIGDDIRPVEAEDIRRANRLMMAASLLMLALTLLARALVLGGLYYASL